MYNEQFALGSGRHFRTMQLTSSNTPQVLAHGKCDVTGPSIRLIIIAIYSQQQGCSTCTREGSSCRFDLTVPLVVLTLAMRVRTSHAVSFINHRYPILKLSRLLTENASTCPTTRRSTAARNTDTTKARLPSIVFDDVGDHRRIPNRRPTIDAFIEFSGLDSCDVRGNSQLHPPTRVPEYLYIEAAYSALRSRQ